MNFFQPWTTRALILAVVLPLPLFASPSAGPQDSSEVVEYLQGNLKNDRELEGTRVTVKVVEGVAILSGRVGLIAQEKRAIRTAEAMKGVRAVISRIQILPSQSSDEATLAAKSRKALEESPAVQAGSVNVQIQGTTAILEGAVDSPEERTAAADVLGTIAGVREVKNQLSVRTGHEIPSARLEAQIALLLKDDVMLQGLEFGVRVDDHVVKLSGAVSSKDDKARLHDLVVITGVTDVDVTAVKIDRSLVMEEFEIKKPTDESIRSALQASFTVSAAVPETVQSQVENGFVTLKGTVDEVSTKEVIGRLAQQTVGVSQVFNQIEIAGFSSKTDGAMSANVAALLLADPQLRSLELFTHCEAGVCTLRGISFTDDQRAQASKVARSLEGVHAVIDRITVEGSTREEITAHGGDSSRIASAR